MTLADLPLAFALVGLALYTVLAGADFGAGLWSLVAGNDERAGRVRDASHEAMAPVWEANHVWLIFVLTVVWTAYPTAFGSIASTLSIPLFVAAIGIVLRGATYALRAGAASTREKRWIDTGFAIASVLTPLALGAAVGAIASRRVPVGNAAGHLVSSWANPTSALIGVLAVVAGAYLAAVYLAADCRRHGDAELEGYFRLRALAAGAVAGVVAVGGLAVVHGDAHPLFHRLVAGPGLPGLVVSLVAGVATLVLVWSRRYEPARYSAALAVAAIIAGWALAQNPVFLPGLTVHQAAAPHDTLVAVTIAVIGGAVILFPSLALLFGFVLRGDRGGVAERELPPAGGTATGEPRFRSGLLARLAVAAGIAGVGFTGAADAGWAHGVGVAFLFSFVGLGFVAVRPWELAREEPGS